MALRRQRLEEHMGFAFEDYEGRRREDDGALAHPCIDLQNASEINKSESKTTRKVQARGG